MGLKCLPDLVADTTQACQDAGHLVMTSCGAGRSCSLLEARYDVVLADWCNKAEQKVGQNGKKLLKRQGRGLQESER